MEGTRVAGEGEIDGEARGDAELEVVIVGAACRERSLEGFPHSCPQASWHPPFDG
jgi:hypothetical protein